VYAALGFLYLHYHIITVKKPKVGMRLEMRDADYIWSPARVVAIDKVKDGTHVICRYDGWGDTFDERALWESERLAPLFCFTKRVKCLVNILSKPKSNPRKSELDALPPGARKTYSNLWPCVVQIRMPHPFVEGLEDEDNCLYAEEFLKDEDKVFIQPYAPHLLPQPVRECSDQDGGRWLNAKRLRLWTDEPSKLGVLPKNFDQVYEIAKNDTETVGFLPASAIEKGSLLKAIYRVHSRAGAQLLDGALHEVSDVPERLQEEPPEPVMKPPAVVQIRQDTLELVPSAEAIPNLQLPVPPPSLPPPIEITDSIYYGCGVTRCKLTNQWTASVCLGGNELFLGTFPTQTQAYQATRIAAGEDVKMETDERTARLKDLHAVPIEAVIETKEKHYKPEVHEFSLHDYSLQKIRYEAYRIQMEGQQQDETNDSESQTEMQAESIVAVSSKKKRKGAPRKVDLEKHCYID